MKILRERKMKAFITKESTIRETNYALEAAEMVSFEERIMSITAKNHTASL
jgi:hypothetical protein